ncbi:NADPH-dependent 7-cyano-7-deazaguanine reductase QueF [Thiotrichales bacterium 19S3-7]|nr:NADPH-dependent 7-cyano-7-deazaguanine reductase QueF [Thiotrichales bacterium 19S3-7]MCF6801098.1 NADPH-dependent 7-cyano-7-deazaguanine reductase QueF [Thiotrichales bacterium 19S3-11]
MNLEQSQLGKNTAYQSNYDKRLLFPIPRKLKRDELGIVEASKLFLGFDLWNAYEVSWLNHKGKPIVRIFKFIIDAASDNIIESKSLKLYLNSFNNTKFESDDQVIKTVSTDLASALAGDIKIISYKVDEYTDTLHNSFDAVTLDDIDCEIEQYQTNADLLELDDQSTEIVTEKLSSHLLKSNCLVTNQPDWASVLIEYTGKKISHEALLKYIVSFRNHNEFHEQCVERIFSDIITHCQPEKLLVYARYTRRGGLDINPIRANYPIDDYYKKLRLTRQ